MWLVHCRSWRRRSGGVSAAVQRRREKRGRYAWLKSTTMASLFLQRLLHKLKWQSSKIPPRLTCAQTSFQKQPAHALENQCPLNLILQFFFSQERCPLVIFLPFSWIALFLAWNSKCFQLFDQEHQWTSCQTENCAKSKQDMCCWNSWHL